jgi:hypothetical protein
MPNGLKSSASASEITLDQVRKGSQSGASSFKWLKMGAIAATSAALGGLAAAWFYRKTLSQLREAAGTAPDSRNEITENETEEDF